MRFPSHRKGQKKTFPIRRNSLYDFFPKFVTKPILKPKLFFDIQKQVVGTFCYSTNSFFLFRLLSGIVAGAAGVVCFVYGQELLPTKLWAFSGNVFPFFFACGIDAVF